MNLTNREGTLKNIDKRSSYKFNHEGKQTINYLITMIKIRLYNKADQIGIDKMIELIATEFKLPISNPNKASSPVLDKFWVALDDNTIMGTVGVINIEGEFSMLKMMFVKKEYRGKEYSIASMLLNKVFDWCNSQGVDTIYLGTMEQFKAAHKFYENNGFEKINSNELPLSFITNPIDDVFYKRKLIRNNTSHS
jgi:N-acetylglutamate synthase-like GNAT family acetyltransferase